MSSKVSIRCTSIFQFPGPLCKIGYANGLGFGQKWMMGWMHDTLNYFHRPFDERPDHQQDIAFSIGYAFDENFMLPLSHDEVVHGKGSLIGKMYGTAEQKFANLRCLFCYMFMHPGTKLIFMGSESRRLKNGIMMMSFNGIYCSHPLI